MTGEGQRDEGSIKERMSRGLRATLVSRTVYILANAGLMLALTRYLLTPESYGQLTFALAILGSMHLFVGLGWAKSGARYVTEYLETDPSQVVHVLRTTLGVLVGSVAVVGTALWVFHGELAALLGTSDLEPFLLVGVGYIALYPLSISIRLLFNAFNRITWSAILRAVDGLSRFCFATAFVLLGFGAVGALMGYVVGFAVAAVLGVAVFYWRFYPSLSMSDRPTTGLRRQVLRYGVPLTVTSAADVLDRRVDAILVGVLVNPTAVGFYTLAKQVADFAVVPAQSIDTTIAPRMGERKASDNVESAARIYETALKYVLILYVPAGVGLAIVARPAVQYVFGRGYLDAAPVLQVFGVFLVVNAVHYITANSLDYLGRGRERAVVNGGTSLANAVLTAVLVPTFGIVGAAIATVITHSVYTAANLYYLLKEIPFRPGRLLSETATVVAIALGMGAVVTLSLPYVSDLPSLVAAIGLGAATWAGLTLASGILDLTLVREVLTRAG